MSMIRRLLSGLVDKIRHGRGDPGVFTNRHKRYKAHQIGEWTYGFPEVPLADEGGKLIIGRFCSIGSGVKIYIGNEHHLDWISTYPFGLAFPDARDLPFPARTKGDVVIGHDVWIGTDAMILSGVTVGNGAVVGARTLVTKDVPPYAVVGGVPSHVIKYRFDPSTIQVLQAHRLVGLAANKN